MGSGLALAGLVVTTVSVTFFESRAAAPLRCRLTPRPWQDIEMPPDGPLATGDTDEEEESVSVIS